VEFESQGMLASARELGLAETSGRHSRAARGCPGGKPLRGDLAWM